MNFTVRMIGYQNTYSTNGIVVGRGLSLLKMSRTPQRTTCFYLSQEDVRRLDELRGIFSRSKMGVIAVKRLIKDIETGRLILPTEMMTAKSEEEDNSGVMGFPKAITNTTYTSYVTPTSIGVPKTTEGLSSVEDTTS
jgi:hypothetical protein